MIIYNKKNSWKMQILNDCEKLTKYKNSYNKRIKLYNVYLSSMNIFNGMITEKKQLKEEELKNKIKIFQTQVNKIDNNLNTLNKFNTEENLVLEKKEINKYNQKYKEIKENYVSNSLLEEETTINYIENLLNNFSILLHEMKQKHVDEIEKIKEQNNKLKSTECTESDVNEKKLTTENINKGTKENKEFPNNNTLLISEKLNKIILPYTAKEILEILENNKDKYKTVEEIIENKFTRNFSDFRLQFLCRYNETMKLARERENYSLTDAITLSAEMMKKRYLHPAIIAACRTLNELDVYLDCLDKNELEDFKIFKIKYELYPMLIKNKKGIHAKEKNNHIIDILKNIFKRNRRKNIIKNEKILQ